MSNEQPQLKNEDFKKIEKLQVKAIRITNFISLNVPGEKKEYTKTKGLHHASKGCLHENAPSSFNDKF